MRFELNPILIRETRARWRSRAFLLLFCGAVFLAFAMILAYHGATQSWGYMRGMNSSDRASQAGAQLFSYMTYYQIIGWMLLAPALTATTLAAEREHGLLEGLQLSPLTAGQIVRGKLYSALAFIGLLLLATQPIMSICFVLGGVSPQELVSGYFQVFLTALTGASLGLCVSAWSRRAASAVGNTLGFILLWAFGFVLLLGFTAWAKFHKIPFLPEIFMSLAMLNPAYARFVQQNMMLAPMAGFAVPFLEPESLSQLFMAISSMLLLLGSVPAVRKPFTEQYWVDAMAASSKSEKMREIQPVNAGETAESGPPKLASKTARSKQTGTVHIAAARFITSKNPILQRDLRARLLFRRPGSIALIFQYLMLFGLAYAYLYLLFKAFNDPNSREVIWVLISGGALFGMLIAPASSAGTAITREKESGTWQGLRLSLMRPGEIIYAKLLSSMASGLLFVLIILPFVPACLQMGRSNQGIQSWQMLLTFPLLFVTAWFTAAWGLLVSNRCHKTAAATTWTLGSLFFLMAILPGIVMWIVDEISGYGSNPSTEILTSLHPFGAYGLIYDTNSNLQSAATAAFGIGCIFMAGIALLMTLHTTMQRQAGREE